MGYLISEIKAECFGCEACAQVCPSDSICMTEDAEGFRYPVIQKDTCIQCGACIKVCPMEALPEKYPNEKYVFGGYHLDKQIRFHSTSGGAFSAIVDAYCDENYVVFGAEAKGLQVFHSYITDKREIAKFQKSKYSQSVIADAYIQVRQFLHEGKKVLFSGTPCQIAGLKSYLKSTEQHHLLTVEVICEGVPTPLYVRKYEQKLKEKYGAEIELLDYRYKGKSFFQNGKWDFQIMRTVLAQTTQSNTNKTREWKIDRWFNPFWSVWLNHLMSRPSCYSCKFTTPDRVADITLGDLWGVHIYCPELYGKNGGASLVVCNSEKGKLVFHDAQKRMYGNELRFDDALKFQGPMRKSIAQNPERSAFMQDVMSDISFDALNQKWAKRPGVKLLWQKYIWGNRQKIFLWNINNRNRADNTGV